jgi:endo-1,4-beta-D-glucanase Y
MHTKNFAIALSTLALAACDVRGGQQVPAAALQAQQPRRAYSCAASMAPDQRAADAELRAGYAAWRDRYVTSRGAGGFLRVTVGAEYRDRTVSEGIGYGMLLAAYLDDQGTFDALWSYAKRYRNARGLMAWEIEASGAPPPGAGSAATDADEDIAFALVVADRRWGGYRAEAVRLIGALMRHTVEPGTFVLRPGDTWGGSEVTNPSYFTPAYYKVFAGYTGDARWNRVVDSSYRIMDRVAARNSTGLQPDWTNAAGEPLKNQPGRGYDYTYNAARVPWRLAKDAAWNCDPRARRHLDRLNAFFGRVGARNILDGYTMAGRVTAESHNAVFVAPAAAGAMMSRDARYRASMWAEMVRVRDRAYYGDSLRLLSLLLASGNMPPPRL